MICLFRSSGVSIHKSLCYGKRKEVILNQLLSTNPVRIWMELRWKEKKTVIMTDIITKINTFVLLVYIAVT